jgi:hypothetical protein
VRATDPAAFQAIDFLLLWSTLAISVRKSEVLIKEIMEVSEELYL